MEVFPLLNVYIGNALLPIFQPHVTWHSDHINLAFQAYALQFLAIALDHPG